MIDKRCFCSHVVLLDRTKMVVEMGTDQQNTAVYDQLIREHYDSVAGASKDIADCTMSDKHIRQKETNAILEVIAEYSKEHGISDFSLIDVGCGNGYSLSQIQERFPQAKLSGVEYTDSMRALAVEHFEGSAVTIAPGDIRDPKSLPSETYDILLCQRVLINLLSPEDQQNALKNLLALVKKGGYLIFIESFQEGLDRLNEARGEFGLSAIDPAHHNLYLSSDLFATEALEALDIVKANLLSTHFFVARVLHAAFLEASGAEFKRNSHFVNFLSQGLPDAVGDYAPLRILAFRRK